MNWKLVLFLFAAALGLAVFEIQIEGARGWAQDLPCWRASPGSFAQTVYGMIMNDKPCDGFHVSEIILLLVFFHMPFAWGVKWNASEEFKILAYFFALGVCWDFLWFVCNPAYGWSNFNAAHIWWHKYWDGPFPRDYYGGFGVTLVCTALAGYFSGTFWPTAGNVLANLTGFVALTAATGVLGELVRHYR